MGLKIGGGARIRRPQRVCRSSGGRSIRVAWVAAKEFVGAVAANDDGHQAAGELRQQVQGGETAISGCNRPRGSTPSRRPRCGRAPAPAGPRPVAPPRRFDRLLDSQRLSGRHLDFVTALDGRRGRPLWAPPAGACAFGPGGVWEVDPAHNRRHAARDLVRWTLLGLLAALPAEIAPRLDGPKGLPGANPRAASACRPWQSRNPLEAEASPVRTPVAFGVMAAASARLPPDPARLHPGPPGANSVRAGLIAAPGAGLLRVRSCSMSGTGCRQVLTCGLQTALAARRDAIIGSCYPVARPSRTSARCSGSCT
jgi:hypothetical protein